MRRLSRLERIEALGHTHVESDLPPIVRDWCVGDDQPEASFLQWGLISSWSKEPKGLINTRAETLEEKPSFKESFYRRRCLILADGFYEWERTGKNAQPYYFQMRDESTFAFAGIWDAWQVGQQSVTSCAIITTKANELLETIHDLICTNSVKAG